MSAYIDQSNIDLIPNGTVILATKIGSTALTKDGKRYILVKDGSIWNIYDMVKNRIYSEIPRILDDRNAWKDVEVLENLKYSQITRRVTNYMFDLNKDYLDNLIKEPI